MKLPSEEARQDPPPVPVTGVYRLPSDSLLMQRTDFLFVLSLVGVFGMYLGSRGFFRYLCPFFYFRKAKELWEKGDVRSIFSFPGSQ